MYITKHIYFADVLPYKLIRMNSDLTCQYPEFAADRLLVFHGNNMV